jgi:hypothetical protein
MDATNVLKRSKSLPANLHLKRTFHHEDSAVSSKKQKINRKEYLNKYVPLVKAVPAKTLESLLHDIAKRGCDGEALEAANKIMIFALDGSLSMSSHSDGLIASVVRALDKLKSQLKEEEKESTYVLLSVFNGDGYSVKICVKKVVELVRADIEGIYSNEGGTPLHIHMAWLLQHIIRTKENAKKCYLHVVTDGDDWPRISPFSYNIHTDEGKALRDEIQQYVDTKFIEFEMQRSFLFYNMAPSKSLNIVRNYSLNGNSRSIDESTMETTITRSLTDALTTLRQGSN